MNQEELIGKLIETRHRLAAELGSIDETIQALTREVARTNNRLARAEAPARMSIARASRYLGISRGTMYKLIDQGTIPSVVCREGSSRVVVRRVDLEEYIDGLQERARTRRTANDQLERVA
jgi:excisionase family DNA binding protein